MVCLIKIELSKITYSFQILLGLKSLPVCFFNAIFPTKIPSSAWGPLVYYTVNYGITCYGVLSPGIQN